MSDPPLSISDIEDQIAVRKVLIHEMVGQLYPDILRGEIQTLLSIRASLLPK